MATARAIRSETARPRRQHESEAEPRLQLVRPRRNLKVKLTPRTGVTLTAGLFTALFGVAVSHALLIEGQSQLDQLDQDVADEQARYERLRLDVAELESPERIQTEAAELGLVPPDDVVWLTPDQAAAGAAAGSGDAGTAGTGETESADTDTSWTEVKPYLGSTP